MPGTPHGHASPQVHAGRARAGAFACAVLVALGLALVTFAAAPISSANAGCRSAGAKPGQLTKREARRAIRCLINARRKQRDLRTLDPDRRLRRSAQGHTAYMREHSCFGHQCPGEPDLATRLRKVGYAVPSARPFGMGEVIAWGRRDDGSPLEVVRYWMASATHRDMVLRARFRDFGVGFVDGTPTGPRGGMYTVDFGYRNG